MGPRVVRRSRWNFVSILVDTFASICQSVSIGL